MKKTIKSIFAMLALSSLIFASCDDDKKTETVVPGSSSTVKITLNTGTHAEISISQFIDTIPVIGTATITGTEKIARLEVRRTVLSIPGDNKLMKVDSTLNTASLSIKLNDVRTIDNLASLIADDKITYLVTITDSKGVKTIDSLVYVVKPFAATAPGTSIILGASANSQNNSHFFGYVNNFQKYSTGTDSVSKDIFGKVYVPARRNSEKIDFVFFSNMQSATVLASLYSPNYPFATGEGYNAEIATWAVKKNTQFIRLGTEFSITEFNPPSDPSFNQVVNLIRALKFDGNDVSPKDPNVKLAQPVNKINKLKKEEIIAFKTAEGKVGLILIAVIPVTDVNGNNFEVQVKMVP